MTPVQQDFYFAGGTLGLGARSYVERRADRELYEGLLAGQFCYVLTARQMGKSSLMMRVSTRLRAAGIDVAHLDLTAVGQNVSAEQWYCGLLLQLGERLDLEEELMRYWQAARHVGLLQGWMRAIREVVLPRCLERLVIFIDEIDMTRSLPFSADEFFAGIRESHNEGSQSCSLGRVTFGLLGVAAPADLIRDPRITPFNVGRRIELHDFTPAEAEPLAMGLGTDAECSLAQLKRILHWTHGHPYLTQRLCLEVTKYTNVRNHSDVDGVCAELFFSPRAQERDHNLLFVRDCMLGGEADLAGRLDLYRQVRAGKKVRDDGTNHLVSMLQLSGIAWSEAGTLKVRNRIYEQVFDHQWINNSMPDAELRRQRTAYRRGMLRSALIGACILVLVSGFAVWAVMQTRQAERLLYDREMRLALDEWERGNVDRVAELVDATTPSKPWQEDLRGFEWSMFKRSVHSDVLDRPKEDYPVAAIARSPDGNSLTIAESRQVGAPADRAYVLKAYDLVAQKLDSGITVQADISFGIVAFSPDGKRVVVADPYESKESNAVTATLRDMRSGQIVTTFRGHTKELSLLAFSPNGATLAIADMGGIISLWDPHNGMRKHLMKNYSGWPRWAAFSSDSRLLVTADESPRVSLWNVETGTEQQPIVSDKGVTAAVFFPNGQRLLVARKDGTLQVWNIPLRRSVKIMPGHSSTIQSILFSPDGTKFATGGADRTVRVWSVTTLEEIRMIKGHGSAVVALSWSLDGRFLFTGSTDRTFKMWDLSRQAEPVLSDKVTQYLTTSFSPSEQLLAVCITTARKTKILNLSTGQEIVTLHDLTEDPSETLVAAFSPDRSLLATAGTAGIVILWDAKTGMARTTLKGHTSYVYALAFSPDGTHLVSGGKDQSIRLWDVSSGAEIGQFKGNFLNSWRAIFSPDGKNLASAVDGGNVELWDVATLKGLRTFKGHNKTVKAIAFSLDGRLMATGGDDNEVQLWNVRSGLELKRLGLADHVQYAAFSPDSKRLVTGGADGTVTLWDVTSLQELMILTEYTDEVTSITFGINGLSLAASSRDGTVSLWRAAKFSE
jgi:WD40 repeat protein